MPSMPYFHMYPADWIADSNVIEMTMQQEGIYHRLLCMAWLSENCTIPADKKLISANLLKGFEGEELDVVLRLWKPHPDCAGRLYNPRLLKEWRLANSRAEAGARGADSRWHRRSGRDGKPDSNPDGKRHGNTDGKTMPSQNSESRTQRLRTQNPPPNPPKGGKGKKKFDMDAIRQMTIAWNDNMPMGIARASEPQKAPESAKRMLTRINANPYIFEQWTEILYGAQKTYAKMIEEDRADFLTFTWIARKASLAQIEDFKNYRKTKTRRRPADDGGTPVMDRKGGK